MNSDPSSDKVLLSLVVPRGVEDAVVDLLLAHPDLVPGFTTSPGEGHGVRVELLDAGEQVRGSARRVMVRIICERNAANQVLALIKQILPKANLFYWIVPVLASGRL